MVRVELDWVVEKIVGLDTTIFMIRGRLHTHAY
jgi:hypothetical protein